MCLENLHEMSQPLTSQDQKLLEAQVTVMEGGKMSQSQCKWRPPGPLQGTFSVLQSNSPGLTPIVPHGG